MMKTYERVVNQLTTLKLKGVINTLDEAIHESESRQQSYIGFLSTLLNAELDYRIEKRYQKNMSGAHFPVMKDMDSFEFGKVKGITKMDVSQLMEFSWVDNHMNILFFGPPGLGKTHLAISLGVQAVAKGYIVSFERMTALVKLLKTADIQKTSAFRLNRIDGRNTDLYQFRDKLLNISITVIEHRDLRLNFPGSSDHFSMTCLDPLPIYVQTHKEILLCRQIVADSQYIHSHLSEDTRLKTSNPSNPLEELLDKTGIFIEIYE